VVLQILGVVVPLLVAAIPLFRWPTLERRVHGHISLVKELPEGMGKEFRDAVEEELRELGHRSQMRLGRRAQYLEVGARVGIIAVFLSLSTVRQFGSAQPERSLWENFLDFSRVMLAFLGLIAIVLLLWRVSRAFGFITHRDKLDREWRRAQAEGKVMLRINGRTVIVDPDEADEVVKQATSAPAATPE
jgi:hypothetical protein